MPRGARAAAGAERPARRAPGGRGAPSPRCDERYRSRGVAADVVAFIDDMARALRRGRSRSSAAPARPRSPSSPRRASPRVLVPFPHAVDDHQTRNARFLAERGAGAARDARRRESRHARAALRERRCARRPRASELLRSMAQRQARARSASPRRRGPSRAARCDGCDGDCAG